MKTVSIALAALSLATSTFAQSIQTWSSGQGGISMQYAQIANGSNTDLRLRLAAPTQPGWGAVAIGNQMAGSLFFVMYPSGDMKSTTVSLRTTRGNVMPTPVTGYEHAVMNSTIADGMMMADVICYACGSWSSLDTTSSTQRFIHAMGPGSAVSSDDQAATIRQHQIPSGYGFFPLNVGASQFPASDITGTSFFPTTAAATAPSTASSAPASDASDAAAAMAAEMAHGLYVFELVHIHAAMFCIVWLILAPAALWALRFGSVRIHYIIQLVNFFMIIPAFAVAVYMSSFTYPDFDTYHQKIGITVFVLAIVQVLFGSVQHFFFKRHTKRSSLADTSVAGGSDSDVGAEKTNGQPASAPAKPGVLSIAAHLHMWFGRAVMILGGINAPIGFWLISINYPDYLKYAYAVGFAGLVTVLGSIIGVGVVGTLQRRKAGKSA